MRFLMLNWRDPRNPESGGAERVTLAFLAALVRRGHEVFWFANAFEKCASDEVIEGITVVRGGGKGSSVVKAMQWYKRQNRFDLVIDQHHGIPWYAPWWCRTNCVAYIHEVLGPIWKAFYPWPISQLGRWQEGWTHWLYRNIPFWTPSESTRKALEKHGVRKVTVIPNGTDAVPLEQLDAKAFQVPIRLVTVSRLAPNKRVDHAVEALAMLLNRGIEANLTVVGGGQEESNLKELARKRRLDTHVRFAGQVAESEKNAMLREAHFLVHTSLREGWGLNVIEANAMGTPAVVYPVGGLVDSTVPGETGLITASESPQAVADALADLLEVPEKYHRLRVNAWARSKTFVWDHVLPQACDWLEQQAGKPGRH